METSGANLSEGGAATTDTPTSPRLTEEARLRSLIAVAGHLCAKYGTVGLSAGMLDNGNTVHFNLGSLDPPSEAAPRRTSRDSMYLVSSLTKPIFALAIAIMVNDKQYGIDFTTGVEEIFPELRGKTWLHNAQRRLTLADLVDNRTEFPRCTNLWESPNGTIPWKGSSSLLAVLRHLPPNDKFQGPGSFTHARNYSNEGFALAAAILEKRTGMSWVKFIRQRILEPLGMHNTHLARSFSTSMNEHIKEIQSWASGEPERVDYKRIFDYVRDGLRAVEPVEVAPSQASDASEDLSSTLIGAAAGIVSSVSDLLKFYAKFVELYHLPEHQKPVAGSSSLAEVERGMLTVQKHILDLVVDKTCAYAAGWSTSMVPWDPHSSPRPRRPGEDGDNARWMNKATMRDVQHLDESARPEWPFFRRKYVGEGQRLVLHHGGNMIGATSFCLVDLESKRAVVVLTNTRGYMVDCANFVGMLMATFRDTRFRDHCEQVKPLACFVAGKYLQEVYKYEQELKMTYPSWPISTFFEGCLGTYELTDGIFATISARESDGRLIFQLYGNGYPYELRLPQSTSSALNKMTIAASMTDLLPTGVGGNNRLDLKGFEIEFQRKEARTGKWQEFVWDFSMTGKTETDVNIRKLYTFRRVADRL
ncbi:beta-lactamase/transpeptidase-like protein [Immersiella caudata]|uniref:Beta-lactamase/transpeptidase-like protein n=1 Tax=Immersiella caudata TaxID=314043 RepID=A0AA39WKE2_9PEZI|nr:beta-lactamase/transpeptidase-like protein [Immersiella caudata]